MAHPRSISRALGVLLAMVLVPLLAGFLVLLLWQAGQEREATRDRLAALARALTEAVDRELERGVTESEVLAQSALIDAGLWREMREYSRRVAERLPGALFAVTDQSGQLLFNTSVPWGTPLPNVWQLAHDHREVEWQGRRLPLSSQDLTRQAFAQRRPVFSNLYFGINVQRPTLALAVPVLRDGRPRYTLTYSFPPAMLEPLLESAIPASVRAVVIDRNGRIVASNRAALARLGDLAIPVPMAAGGAAGFYDVKGRDGRPVSGAYAVSSRTGFVVRVSLPRDSAPTLSRPASQAWMLLALAGMAASALLATLFGNRLARPLKQLGRAAREGKVPELAETGISEVDTLAQALRSGVEAEQRRHEEQLLRVTAQQQEALVKDNEARLRRVLDELSASVAVLDGSGRLIECNSAPLRAAGLSREQVIGRPFWECHWWSHDPAVAERVRAAVLAAAAGDVRRFDCTALSSGGSQRMIDLQLAPLREDDGRIANVIASGIDIEARTQVLAGLRRSEARAQQAARTLEAADRQKDEFLATLAHELRNPLAPIRNSVELLRRALPPHAVAQRATDIIERQSAHLTHLVDDLLDVSRITRGKVRLRLQAVDLASVARTAAETVKKEFDEAAVALHVDAPHGAVVAGDPTRLAQCILNLLANARKFTPAGGDTWLAVQEEGDQAVVTVRDTGIGLEAGSMDRIFELFVQEQRSGMHGNSGLGIGLALTRKLVELHGGNISAASEGSGRGSTFRIELPLTTVALPQATSEPGGNAVGHSGGRVLVVDDNQDAADTLVELLAMHGFEPRAAYDGRTALEAVRAAAPGLVLLDIGLPDLNGYQVCQEIRAAFGPVPTVIALTGWGQERDRRNSEEAGFDAHLTKPVDPGLLLTTIAQLRAKREG